MFSFTIWFIRGKQTKKEIIPYPICSVVAVFKMLVRILNTLRSRIWDMVLFLFSVFWLHVNECNSLWREMGEGTKGCGLFWCLFQVSLMIIWCRKLLLYMMNLSLYCRNISFFLFWRDTFRASSRLLTSPPSLLKNYCIHFFWSRNTENKKNRP